MGLNVFRKWGTTPNICLGISLFYDVLKEKKKYLYTKVKQQVFTIVCFAIKLSNQIVQTGLYFQNKQFSYGALLHVRFTLNKDGSKYPMFLSPNFLFTNFIHALKKSFCQP